jgi:hypothetical protein
MRNLLRVVALIFVLVVPSVIVRSADYYADVNIVVDERGLVTVAGNTNHPNLTAVKSSYYTSKKGEIWTLNITLPDDFSNYIYELDLPKDSVLNYLKTPKLSRIEDDYGRMKIIGTGQDKPFVVVAQYRIDYARRAFPYSLAIVPLGVFGLALHLILRRKKTKGPDFHMESLSDRQKVILELVRKHKTLSQSKIEKITGLPKASLSRNIESLVRKGILKKEEKGMTNMIYLQDQ